MSRSFVGLNEIAPAPRNSYRGYGKRMASSRVSHNVSSYRRVIRKAEDDGGYPQDLPVTLLVPGLVQLRVICQDLPPSSLPRLCVFLHLIASSPYREDRDGFTHFSRSYLTEFIGDYGYRLSRDIFEKSGLVECKLGGFNRSNGRRRTRAKQGQCNGYRLTDKCHGPAAPYELPPRFAQRWRAAQRALSNQAVQRHPSHVILWENLQSLTIDGSSAARICPDPQCPKWREEQTERNARRVRRGLSPLPDSRLAAWQMQVIAIEERRLTFSSDPKTGRVFHNLSNLAKPLRRGAARLNGEALAEVDIKNSQPYLLAGLYSDPTSAEASRFRHLASSGQIYEELLRINDIPVDQRALGKTEFFRVIFGQKYTRESSKLWPGIREHFPVLAAIIEGFHGNSLSLLLQSREAEMMIGKVVPALAAALPGVPFLTIHDSVALPVAYAKVATKTISHCCSEEMKGLAPTLDVTLPG
jgi:hypothetical protein